MTAPIATVCAACDGERFVIVRTATEVLEVVCESCCCGICGEPTDTPPECASCFIDEDARAVRRADR